MTENVLCNESCLVVLLSIHTLLISCYCSAYSIKVRKFAEINLEKCLSEEFCSCSPYTLYCFIFSRRPWGSVYRCRWGWCCRRHGRFTMGTEVPQGTLYHISCVFILWLLSCVLMYFSNQNILVHVYSSKPSISRAHMQKLSIWMWYPYNCICCCTWCQKNCKSEWYWGLKEH